MTAHKMLAFIQRTAKPLVAWTLISHDSPTDRARELSKPSKK